MPTYEYRCDSCDQNFDVVQSFHDDPLTACPTCGSPVRKVFGSVGIVFKGSGFYKTDSRTAARPSRPTAGHGVRLRIRARRAGRPATPGIPRLAGDSTSTPASRHRRPVPRRHRSRARRETVQRRKGLDQLSRSAHPRAVDAGRHLDSESSPNARGVPVQWFAWTRRPGPNSPDAGRSRWLGPAHQGRRPAEVRIAGRLAHPRPMSRRSPPRRPRHLAESIMHRRSSRLQRSTTKPTSPTAFPAPAIPGQRLLPALLGGPGHAPGAVQRRHRRRAGTPRSRHPAGRGDAGAGAGHRSDRFGQDHDPGRHGRPHQPHPVLSHRDDRGPGRVPAHRRPGRHRPARGRLRHRLVLLGHAGRPAPGPRRDPGRRDARHGDGLRGADRGRDRPPGVLDAPHHQRHRDDQPDRRLLPSPPAVPDPGEPGRIAQGHRLPTAHPDGRRQEPGAGARDPGGQRPDPAGHPRSR